MFILFMETTCTYVKGMINISQECGRTYLKGISNIRQETGRTYLKGIMNISQGSGRTYLKEIMNISRGSGRTYIKAYFHKSGRSRFYHSKRPICTAVFIQMVDVSDYIMCLSRISLCCSRPVLQVDFG